MIRFILFLLLICLLAISCQSSARFRAIKKNQNEKIKDERRYNNTSNHLNMYVEDWLHTPYKYGGMSRSGVDCSGFSSLVMLNVYNVKIPRTAYEQYKQGKKIRDILKKPGDLVFFKNVRGSGVDHVGVYLGDSQFAHASESAGVIISGIDEKYYRIRYVGTCRYTK